MLTLHAQLYLSFLWLVPSLIAIYVVIIPTFKTLCIAILILLVTIFYMQLVAKAGLTLLATFNYKVLPQVTTELCYKESQIRVRNCIGVYHQWADNTLELFAWYAWRGICGWLVSHSQICFSDNSIFSISFVKLTVMLQLKDKNCTFDKEHSN